MMKMKLILCLGLSFLRIPLYSGESPTNPFSRDTIDLSVNRGIAYLISIQDRKSGWISDKGTNRTAMSALAIMAMASAGHGVTDPSPAGRAMARALRYVLQDDRQDARGYFGRASGDGSRMYGHGIITLMLGEMAGMGEDDQQDALIRKRLEKAVKLIMDSQHYGNKKEAFRGGWRYEPSSPDADLSVTVWQVMALRSAKNAGVEVPKQVIKDAADYIRRSHKSKRDSRSESAELVAPFMYQPPYGRAGYSTTAAGLLALQVCGYYDDPTVKGAADWLLENGPRWQEQWFFYGTYYYAQGMHQRSGKYATEGARRVREILLERQDSRRGWWEGKSQEHGAGRVYSTSMAILSLTVKCHFLPIYQR